VPRIPSLSSETGKNCVLAFVFELVFESVEIEFLVCAKTAKHKAKMNKEATVNLAFFIVSQWIKTSSFLAVVYGNIYGSIPKA
jgi:hypothetical protein